MKYTQTTLLLLVGFWLTEIPLAAQYTEYLDAIKKYESNKNRKEAIAECRKAVADKTLSDKQRHEITLRLATNAMMAKDYTLTLEALEQASVIPANDRRRESSLRMDSFRNSNRDKQYVIAEQLGTSLLKQTDLLDAKRKAAFYPLLIQIYCRNGSQAALDSLASHKELPEEAALELEILTELRKVPADKAQEVLDSLPVWKTLAPTRQAELLYRTATFLLLLNYDSSSQKVLELAQKMEVPFQRNRYVMKSVDMAPPGAGGWILSDAWQQGGANEFKPYSHKAQANLIADVAAERLEATNKNLDYYLKNTRFNWLYDDEGVHLFIVSGENELEKYRLLNSGAGSLEVFISPGMERENYHQFIIELPSGKTNFYEKNSFHRSYRQIADFMKLETICRDGKMGTYVFVPWIFFYDVLPFDTHSNWRFNVIRWTPAGGISWGGRVHELGRMGELDWTENNPAMEQKIRRRIAEHAVAKYQKEKVRLLEYWNDSELGDPDFCQISLIEAFKKLDAAVAEYQSKKTYFTRDTMSDLMETEYLAQELRKEYLSQKMQTSK